MRTLFCMIAVASLAGCFNPNSPTCTYSCGDAGLCPSGYTCVKTDNFCHRNDSISVACDYPTLDLSVGDQSLPDLFTPDLSASFDMTDASANIDLSADAAE